MPYDANGNYTLPTSYFVENGNTVLPIQHNPPFEDVQQALSSVILRSGVAPMSGALKMGNNKITGLAAGTLGTDAVAKSQLDLAAIKYAVKGVNYTAVASDNNTVIRFTAAATLSLTAAATLGLGWSCKIMAKGGNVVIDPESAEQIDGADNLLIPVGYSATVYCDGTAFFSDLDVPDPYEYVPLGDILLADDGITGFVAPPTNRRYRFVELTAGLTGSGQYNNGVLTTEVVSGTFPLNTATAVVSLAGSPYLGQAIRLLNTERRFLRPGSAGILENDTLQGHWHIVGQGLRQVNSFSSTGAVMADINNGQDAIALRAATLVSDGFNGTPRSSTETRPKNVGVRAFRRIK